MNSLRVESMYWLTEMGRRETYSDRARKILDTPLRLRRRTAAIIRQRERATASHPTTTNATSISTSARMFRITPIKNSLISPPVSQCKTNVATQFWNCLCNHAVNRSDCWHIVSCMRDERLSNLESVLELLDEYGQGPIPLIAVWIAPNCGLRSIQALQNAAGIRATQVCVCTFFRYS